MQREKEIEMLIARYRTDIAALDEREEDLMRECDIIQNMIPNILVSYMGKVIQTSQDKPFPQQEIETEVIGKVEHLKQILKELQIVIGMVKEEKHIMKKRIEELEACMTNQPEVDFNTNVNINTSQPDTESHGIADTKHDKGIEDVRTSESDGQEKELENLTKTKDTDWEKVYRDLQNQVINLTKNLNNSSQKLLESKDYVKNLEEKHCSLKKELEAQIKKLEKRTNKVPSEIVNKEQNILLQKNEVESNSKNNKDNLGMRPIKEPELKTKLSNGPESHLNKIKDTNISDKSVTLNGGLSFDKVEHQLPDPKSEGNGEFDAKSVKETKKCKKCKNILTDRPEENKQLDPELKELAIMDAKKEKRNVNFEVKDQLPKFEELLQAENTDWKKVYEDLQKQVLELTEHLNDSLQKLTKSKSYVTNLEDKYSNLKKELISQIQMLEKRTDSFISDVIDKEKDKNLSMGSGNKDIILAMQESLSEMKSIKKAELKTSITGQPKDHLKSGNVSDITDISKSKNNRISDEKIGKEFKAKQVLSQELSQHKNTDWKKVCEDLQTQVKELTESLNNSTQNFKQSEDYIKHLQGEYSKLEKELRSRIQSLEKRTDALISAIVNKEQEKYLQEQVETKGTKSAIHEVLSEVRSLKETLTKPTVSKVCD